MFVKDLSFAIAMTKIEDNQFPVICQERKKWHLFLEYKIYHGIMPFDG